MAEARATDPGIDLAGLTLLVATKKGAFFLGADGERGEFRLQGPAFLGHIIHHAAHNPRHGRAVRIRPDP